jgi:hypothetical protein
MMDARQGDQPQSPQLRTLPIVPSASIMQAPRLTRPEIQFPERNSHKTSGDVWFSSITVFRRVQENRLRVVRAVHPDHTTVFDVR